jgi:hypothetical protein
MATSKVANCPGDVVETRRLGLDFVIDFSDQRQVVSLCVNGWPPRPPLNWCGRLIPSSLYGLNLPSELLRLRLADAIQSH